MARLGADQLTHEGLEARIAELLGKGRVLLDGQALELDIGSQGRQQAGEAALAQRRAGIGGRVGDGGRLHAGRVPGCGLVVRLGDAGPRQLGQDGGVVVGLVAAQPLPVGAEPRVAGPGLVLGVAAGGGALELERLAQNADGVGGIAHDQAALSGLMRSTSA